MKKLTNVQMIKRYFADGGRKVGMAELRALTDEERAHLAELASKALGVELVAAWLYGR